jgi:hypothetical protein
VERRADHFGRDPDLTEDDLLLLDFRRDASLWRERLADRARAIEAPATPGAYYEVHAYCELDDAERALWSSRFTELGLWAQRYRFCYERVGDELIDVDAARAREEVMLGSHLFAQDALVPQLAGELSALYARNGVSVQRLRIERPIARARAETPENGARWWEAHVRVNAGARDVFAAMHDADIRDISAPADFISGVAETGCCYINLEARAGPLHALLEKLTEVERRIAAAGAWQGQTQIEEVVVDQT